MIRPVQIAMNPELPDDIEIGYSSWRFLPPIGFALAMMFLSTALALDWVEWLVMPASLSSAW
jgi:hypothetical protein